MAQRDPEKDTNPAGDSPRTPRVFIARKDLSHRPLFSILALVPRLRDLDIERERLTALVGSDGTADSPKDMGAVDTVQRPGMGRRRHRPAAGHGAAVSAAGYSPDSIVLRLHSTGWPHV